MEGYTFQTIYFGGGTPSYVDAEYIKKTIALLKKEYKFSSSMEITIEMNPNSAKQEKIAAYKKMGINRFSIGLQTAIDRQLQEIGRVHTLYDFQTAVKYLKGENFNVDILLGLKGQRLEDIYFTLEQAIASGSTHLSIYALTPEEGTPIFKDYENNLLPDADTVASYYEAVVEILQKEGFYQYEISNFCKKGKEAKHNLLYWRRKEYIGFGLSAASFINESRFTNSDDLDAYIQLIMAGKDAAIFVENITEKDRKFEYIMLAFRLVEGVNLLQYRKLFGKEFTEEFDAALYKNKKYLQHNKNYICIAPQYLYRQNQIIMDFFPI